MALEQHGFTMTTQELHDRVRGNFSYEALRKLLSRMASDGELTKERQGKDNVWAVAPRSSEAVPIDMNTTAEVVPLYGQEDPFGA